MTFSLGRIAGIPVRLHWSALLVAAYLAYSLGAMVSLVATAVGVACFGLSILVHELGHALMASRCGVTTTSIDLWALGGVARLATEAPAPKAEALIAVAGPSSSALAAVICSTAWWLLPLEGIVGEIGRVMLWLAYLNTALAIFNMLPGSPLDGGRVLRAARWKLHGDRLRASREAARSGVVIGSLIVLTAIVVSLRGSSQLSLLLVGFFVLGNARAEVAFADMQQRWISTQVGSLAWRFLAEFDERTTVGTMLNEVARLGQAEALIATNGDEQVGLVLLEHALRIPEEERDGAILGDIVRPFSAFPHAHSNENISDVLSALDPIEPLILLIESGGVEGIVPPTRLRNLLGI